MAFRQITDRRHYSASDFGSRRLKNEPGLSPETAPTQVLRRLPKSCGRTGLSSGRIDLGNWAVWANFALVFAKVVCYNFVCR